MLLRGTGFLESSHPSLYYKLSLDKNPAQRAGQT
jgi:hypothetical protein